MKQSDLESKSKSWQTFFSGTQKAATNAAGMPTAVREEPNIISYLALRAFLWGSATETVEKGADQPTI